MITTTETCYSDLGHPYVNVFCNGNKVEYCVSFSIDGNWASHAIVDEEGNFQIDGDEIVLVKTYGLITWEPCE